MSRFRAAADSKQKMKKELDHCKNIMLNSKDKQQQNEGLSESIITKSEKTTEKPKMEEAIHSDDAIEDAITIEEEKKHRNNEYIANEEDNLIIGYEIEQDDAYKEYIEKRMSNAFENAYIVSSDSTKENISREARSQNYTVSHTSTSSSAVNKEANVSHRQLHTPIVSILASR